MQVFVAGRKFKLGRLRPKAHSPRLRLANYLYQALPAPPDQTDYTTKDYPLFKDILGNNTYGDCTIAAAYHITGSLLTNAGLPIPPELNSQNAVQLYLQLTGGQDNGLDEQTVLSYWQRSGLLADGSHKSQAWCAVNALSQIEVKTALYTFENTYFGIQLPDAWLSNFTGQDGFIWDVAGDGDPENGHAVPGLDYDKTGVIINTWGCKGHITWPAVAKYAVTHEGGECYTILSPDQLANAQSKSPAGFDWTQLKADIQAIT